MPYSLAEGGPEQWSELKDEVAARMLGEVRRIVAGVEEDDIIARHVDSPLEMAAASASFQRGDLLGAGSYLHQFGGRRPVPELAQYMVPGIKDLFLVGPFMHPGGGVIGGGRATAVKIFQEWKLDWDAALEAAA